MKCPICKRQLSDADDPAQRPFCSKRCRLIDLSRWLGGEYVIPGAPVLDGPTVFDGSGASFDADRDLLQ